MEVADTIIANVSMVVKARDIAVGLSLPKSVRVDSIKLSVG